MSELLHLQSQISDARERLARTEARVDNNAARIESLVIRSNVTDQRLATHIDEISRRIDRHDWRIDDLGARIKDLISQVSPMVTAWQRLWYGSAAIVACIMVLRETYPDAFRRALNIAGL